MYFDNLTTILVVWGAATVAVVLAITACKGCCIAKVMGRPCRK